MSTVHMQPGPASPLSGLPMLRSLAQNWWLVLLRGIAAIAFGVMAFVWPGITLLTLTFLWGAYALVDGIFALWSAVTGRGSEIAPRWWLAIVGIAGLLAGILTFAWPGMTALILLMFIAWWAIIVGAMEIWGAIRLRKEIEGEWLLGLAGLLSVAFGIAMLVWPGAGALAVVWLIGWYAILLGIVWIALSFRLKQFKRTA